MHQVFAMAEQQPSDAALSPFPSFQNSPTKMEERRSVHHMRDLSFHVKYSPVEIERIAREVYDETVAEVHLSLFIFWISESPKHYEQAKEHIRELGLDQVYYTLSAVHRMR
jgi:hypothetical protein